MSEARARCRSSSTGLPGGPRPLHAAICVGSNAVYRRAALDSNGGTTLIEHSEDVHTGFDLRRNGWPLRYIPVNLATGLCPATFPGSSASNTAGAWAR